MLFLVTEYPVALCLQRGGDYSLTLGERIQNQPVVLDRKIQHRFQRLEFAIDGGDAARAFTPDLDLNGLRSFGFRIEDFFEFVNVSDDGRGDPHVFKFLNIARLY